MRVCITIPTFNESAVLRTNILRLHEFAAKHLPFPWEIVIADNGSTDGTPRIAEALSRQHDQVSFFHLPEPGRGRAIRQAWLRSDADVLSYMDADLSSDLEAFPVLLNGMLSGGYDLAVGSRLLDRRSTVRCLTRELLSRCYNALLRGWFGTGFSDAQCGFKAIRRDAAVRLLPQVEDNAWFFDTELLVLAERLGYRILDLPVRWAENRKSHVKVLQTSLDDIRGLLRLKRQKTSTVTTC